MTKRAADNERLWVAACRRNLSQRINIMQHSNWFGRCKCTAILLERKWTITWLCCDPSGKLMESTDNDRLNSTQPTTTRFLQAFRLTVRFVSHPIVIFETCAWLPSANHLSEIKFKCVQRQTYSPVYIPDIWSNQIHSYFQQLQWLVNQCACKNLFRTSNNDISCK